MNRIFNRLEQDDVIMHDSTPAIRIDDNGNAIAIWTQSDGDDIRVWAARYHSYSDWLAPEVLDDGGKTTPRCTSL